MINIRKLRPRQNQISIKSVILSGIIVLYGCDTYMGGITNTDVKMECPMVSILPEASSITRYAKGMRRTVLDVDFSGKITGIEGKCFYELNSDTDFGIVTINVITKFKMRRGSANKSQKADFLYFASVVNNQGKVLEKQTFPYSIKFSKNRSWVKNEDSPIELIIPLADENIGQNFTVFVGFQLSQEELEFNRNQGDL